MLAVGALQRIAARVRARAAGERDHREALIAARTQDVPRLEAVRREPRRERLRVQVEHRVTAAAPSQEETLGAAQVAAQRELEACLFARRTARVGHPVRHIRHEGGVDHDVSLFAGTQPAEQAVCHGRADLEGWKTAWEIPAPDAPGRQD